VNGTLPVSFEWSNGSSSPFNSSLAAGSYAATVTDGNGCTTSIGPFTLTEPPALMLILYANDINCSGQTSGSISVTAEGGIPPYLYKIADDWVSFGQFDGLTAGMYAVTAADANGCIRQATATVEDISTLTADLGNDITIEAGDSVTLTVLTNVPIGTIAEVQWFGIANVSCTDCLSQTFFPQETRDYQVRIEDVNGCVAFDEIRVEVLPGEDKHSIYVPTAFSPNKDGINDELVLYGSQFYVEKVNSFVILDNWGDVVFQYYNFLPNNNAFGWDGRQRGRLMDPAGFVWYAEVTFTDGVVKRFKGTTILVR
jgi:gliding motility-associated-like protein